MLAPDGKRARLTVLIFHRVLSVRDELRPSEPTAAIFEQRMRWIRAQFNVLPLGEAVAGLKRGSLPERPLAITFDDGYADNHDVALPILSKLGLPATFFVATGYLDGGRMFNDTVIESVRQARGDALDLVAVGLGLHAVGSADARNTAIDAILGQVKRLPHAERERAVAAIVEVAGATPPDDLMMTSDQVAALDRAGMEIGGHTVTHPILATLPEVDAEREIRDGRQRLKDIIGKPIQLFAYPNGKPHVDYTANHARILRELGFDGAVSTAWGTSSPGDDPFQVPRFTPWDAAQWKFGLRLAGNLRHAVCEVV